MMYFIRTSPVLAAWLLLTTMITPSRAQPLRPGLPGDPGLTNPVLPTDPMPFGYPDTITPPFGLQIVNATTTIPTTAKAPYVTHNPSVIFNFPVTPDFNAWLNGGLHFAYKAVGWKGHIYTEACLTDTEALLYPNRIEKGADSATCPSKADVATQTFVARNWRRPTSM